MKRPSGFSAPPKAQAPAGARSPAAPAADPAAAKKRRGGDARDATTEPIPIQSPVAAKSPARGTGAVPADRPVTAAPATPTARSTPTAPRSGATAVTEPAAADREALTPAQARKQLRAARRARKQYERDEVRRFTWRARRRRRIWLVAIGTAAALVGFVVVGAYSPIMALRTIEVVGANRIPADQVQGALSDQLGTPLPLVDEGRIKADLAEFTLIQSYVTESRPPHTLVVRIIEREPVGVVPSKSGFNLVDAAGVVIQKAAERPAGYPVIDARAGVGSRGFQAAAAVVAALPDGIRAQLDSVSAATKDDVTLVLTGGARVVWGSPEKSEYKAVVLGALMVSSPVGTVAEYDVSSPDSAVLR